MTAMERRADLAAIAKIVDVKLSERIAKEKDADQLAKFANRVSNMTKGNLAERANDHLRYFALNY